MGSGSGYALAAPTPFREFHSFMPPTRLSCDKRGEKELSAEQER